MEMQKNLWELSATEGLIGLSKKNFSPEEWFQSCREQIATRDPEVEAFVYLEPTDNWQDGPFPIPLGVKDIIDVAGQPTNFGLPFDYGYIPKRDAGSVSLLRAQGANILGKLVTTELGHVGPGPTRNPNDLSRTPGGSSSGSAAAVAAGMLPVSLGTQTAGSVIRPASYNGVFGYKPTLFDFDRSGILPNAPSFDSLGILSRCVDDLALMRHLLLEQTVKPLTALGADGLRIGYLQQPLIQEGLGSSWDCLDILVDQISQLGCTIANIPDIIGLRRLIDLHRIISGFEFRRSIAHERFHHFDQLSHGLRMGRLADGETTALSVYQSARSEVAHRRARIESMMEELDFFVTLSAPGPAPVGLDSTGNPIFATAWSLLGYPTISLPLLTDARTNMPLGCQLIGKPGQDELLLSFAKTLECHFLK